MIETEIIEFTGIPGQIVEQGPEEITFGELVPVEGATAKILTAYLPSCAAKLETLNFHLDFRNTSSVPISIRPVIYFIREPDAPYRAFGTDDGYVIQAGKSYVSKYGRFWLGGTMALGTLVIQRVEAAIEVYTPGGWVEIDRFVGEPFRWTASIPLPEIRDVIAPESASPGDEIIISFKIYNPGYTNDPSSFYTVNGERYPTSGSWRHPPNISLSHTYSFFMGEEDAVIKIIPGRTTAPCYTENGVFRCTNRYGAPHTVTVLYSPIQSALTEILRPNADAVARLHPVGNYENYKNVNEEVPDEDQTYNYISGSAGDLYPLPKSTGVGPINYVRVHNRVKNILGMGYSKYQIQISTHGSYFLGPEGDLLSNYVTHNYTWHNNPATGLPWTRDEIDNLQIGARSQRFSAGEYRVTQVYAAVNQTGEVEPILRHTLSITINGNGIVDPLNGEFEEGTIITLTATPADGDRFIGWQGTDDDSVNPTTVTMTQDKQVIANFEPIPKYNLTVEGRGQGLIIADTGEHWEGDVITLIGIPAEGWRFSHWEGTDNNVINPTTVTMTSDKHVVLVFIEIAPPPPEMASMTGVVTDEETTGFLPDVLVALNSYRTYAGPDGFYLIENLELGSYTIKFSKSGYKTKELSVTLVEGINTLDVSLEPEKKVNWLLPAVGAGAIALIALIAKGKK